MPLKTGRGSTGVRAVMWGLVVIVAGLTGVILVQRGAFDSPPRVALVTADNDDYWEPVIAGAQAAEDKRGIKVEVFKQNWQAREQTARLEELVARGYEGIAVSPVDADKQAGSLRRLAQDVHLVTLDSDSPMSNRLCFVGCDNYAAGRKCGGLVEEALPDGGKVAIVMGSLDKANGRARRQGLIDELLDRAYNPERREDPVDQTLGGERFTIVGTYIDEISPERARANTVRVLEAHPDIDGIVGLYGYSTPAILAALEEKGMTGEVRVIGFDYNEETLAGIDDGSVHGTIAQDQFNYGMRAVDILGAAAQNGTRATPLSETIHFPTVVVTRDNLDEFRSGFIKKRSSAAAARLLSRRRGN